MVRYICDFCRKDVANEDLAIKFRVDQKIHDLCETCYGAFCDAFKGTGEDVVEPIAPYVINTPNIFPGITTTTVPNGNISFPYQTWQSGGLGSNTTTLQLNSSPSNFLGRAVQTSEALPPSEVMYLNTMYSSGPVATAAVSNWGIGDRR